MKTQFLIDILEEHLGEASFLYEQRIRLLNDPKADRFTIVDLEDRFEPHIDGLVLGEEWGLKICGDKGSEAEPGEIYTAICVFCRQGRKDLILDVIAGIEPDDTERMQALRDALAKEMPDQWIDDFIGMLPENRKNLSYTLANLIGYKRQQAGPELLKILPEKNSKEASDILWALGRIRFQNARHLLLTKYLRDQDESVCISAALALLRMGDSEALNYCMQSLPSQDWPHTLIGIGGDRSAVLILLKKAVEKKAVVSCLIDLGLLGDISAVEILLEHIANPETAEYAILALNLITGAEIYEDAFIPDTIDEDELFPEELEKFQQGEQPTKPDGTPYGVNITRLSQKPEDWQDWWTKNKSRFQDGVRYRNGKPFSPLCLLENIEYEKSPFIIRQLAYEELVIRYGVDFPFEADMYVTQQKPVIKDIAQWIAANSSRFQPGAWYFAGQLIS
jgi:uncharacterized protein (TIGR02270 family)